MARATSRMKAITLVRMRHKLVNPPVSNRAGNMTKYVNREAAARAPAIIDHRLPTSDAGSPYPSELSAQTPLAPSHSVCSDTNNTNEYE